MTKTLTEQWREGTLEDGYYYVVSKWSGKIEINDYYEGCWQDLKEEYIKEVLAPVPSYDEWKQAKENIDKNGTWYTERSYKRLEKKLAIATKALKDCYNDMKYWAVLTHRNQRILSTIKKALKEMEGVK